MAAPSPELYYTTLTAMFTGVMWVPVILNRMAEHGVPEAMGPRPDTPPEAAWASRLDKAHRNAVENLVIFAPLAIAVHVLGLGTPGTDIAAAVFFIARVLHAVIYTLGIPVLRTLAFATGLTCTMILGLRILGLF